ncbi:MAG: hypothetical protein U1E78_08270 [Gammaproteobacteria bacterium]
MLYCFNLITLLLFVYIVPGLACFPFTLNRPLWFIALPVLSGFVVYCLTSLFIFLGIFNQNTVLGTTGILALAALAHLYRIRLRARCGEQVAADWKGSKQYGVFIFINLCVILPFACKLGTHAFDRGDEIYSWHFWAIQHYFSEPIDFYHTGAAYPQLLPKLLAWGYQILGTVDAQLPSKASLAIFSFTLLNAIALVTLKEAKHKLSYLILLIWGLFGIGISRFFDNGYADPVMTAGLIMSIALFIQWVREREKLGIWLSLVCGLAASFAKQPALIWSVFAFPIGLILFHRKEERKLILWVAGLSLIGALGWFGLEGNTFLQNQGVLSASIAGRSWVSQLLFASNQYLLQKPLLTLLILVTAYCIRRDRTLIFLFYGFVIPSLLAWFMAGAYQLRLGQHVIACCLLLIWASPLKLPDGFHFIRSGRYFVAASAALSLGLSLWILSQAYYVTKPGISWNQPGLITLNRYFPKDANQLYSKLYDQDDVLLWVPTRYLYGIFYGHTPVMEPNYQRFKTYNKESLLTELLETSPDYVFTADATVSQGMASPLMLGLIEECPNWFKPISLGPNLYHYQVYELDLSKPCKQNN